VSVATYAYRPSAESVDSKAFPGVSKRLISADLAGWFRSAPESASKGDGAGARTKRGVKSDAEFHADQAHRHHQASAGLRRLEGVFKPPPSPTAGEIALAGAEGECWRKNGPSSEPAMKGSSAVFGAWFSWRLRRGRRPRMAKGRYFHEGFRSPTP
jgi:hypothetical protein